MLTNDLRILIEYSLIDMIKSNTHIIHIFTYTVQIADATNER